MRQFVLAGFLIMVIGISGCAQTLPPQGELDQALRKSFDATGMNYSSKSRITNLSLPKDALPESAGKAKMSLGAGLEIVRGLAINAEGAVDMKGRKSEVLYELRYDRDNVDVSIKVPMYMNYDTQTIYVGPSLLTTILETFFPQAPSTRGKLIRINLKELLKEGAESNPELSKLLGENRFSAKNVDLWNAAIKSGTLKALAKLNSARFSDLPLTDDDKKNGIARRIHVALGHDDSVAVVLDLIEGISQALFQDGLISEKEYDMLRSLADKQKLEGVVEQFTLALTFDAGVAQTGHLGFIESQLNVSDKDKVYQLGLSNVITLHNYDAPRFTMAPEKSEVVDIKELLGVFLSDTAAKGSIGGSADEVCEDGDDCECDGEIQPDFAKEL
jgi:hypothetical protein